jgi:hypothetical protein
VTGASTASDGTKQNKNSFAGTRKFFGFTCRNEMCGVNEEDPVRIEYHKIKHLELLTTNGFKIIADIRCPREL